MAESVDFYLTWCAERNKQPEKRFTRRLRDLSQLPEDKKRAILKVLDDLIRANQ